MKKSFRLIAVAMLLAVTFTACKKEGDDPVVEDPTSNTLSSDIKENTTLAKNGTYYIEGVVKVHSGATLKIEEGVQLVAKDGDNVGYILVAQGAKIDAQGTATNPIIMTSEKKEAGAWGGLHICGKAPVNSGENSLSEVGAEPYGGNDPADNSGVIKYVRLEYTGYSYSEEQECNGISFYGVGNGTQVSYVQAYRGSDDGLEFFGGTVNIDHVVVTSCGDDSFDWTDGWRGSGQFLIVFQESKDILGYDTDCFLECDNGKPSTASPMSHPTLSNLTLIGENGTAKKEGVMLKAGTEVSLYNTIVTGKNYDVAFAQGDDAVNHYVNGNSILKGIAITSDGVYTKPKEGDRVLDTNLTSLFTNDGNLLSQTITYNKYEATSPAGIAAVEVVPFVNNNNFTFASTSYIGAGNGWMNGWTK